MIWERYPGELSHHGIKGQKWGVKHGPPYPLKKGNRSAKSFDDIPKKRYNSSADEDMRDTNPKFRSGNERYQNNCTMCGMAFEMRRRGFEVSAAGSKNGKNEYQILKWFDTDDDQWYHTPEDDEKLSKTQEILNAFPNGSRGFINGYVAAEKGDIVAYHSMFWEKHKGKITIRDTQNNEKYDELQNSIFTNADDHEMYIMRTDNLPINKQNVMEAVEFKGEKNANDRRMSKKSRKK